MKNLALILIFFITFSCKAQLTTVNLNTLNYNDNLSGKYYKDIDGNFDPFLGTWEGITGNITFRVELYKDHFPPNNPPFDYSQDMILGKYYLIEYAGLPNENIICVGQNMVREAYVIIAGSSDGMSMNGVIHDTCIPESAGGSTMGELEMGITAPNTARWTVTRKGMYLAGMEYVIPTDIVLTKQ